MGKHKLHSATHCGFLVAVTDDTPMAQLFIARDLGKAQALGTLFPSRCSLPDLYHKMRAALKGGHALFLRCMTAFWVDSGPSGGYRGWRLAAAAGAPG